MTNESKEQESLPCPHARPSWKMCPYCLGINKINPPKMSLEEFVNAPDEVKLPILEEAVRMTNEEQRRVMEEVKESTGFIEPTVKDENRHALMRELLKLIEKEVGKPCEKYADNCPSCEAWIAFSRLDNFFGS